VRSGQDVGRSIGIGLIDDAFDDSGVLGHHDLTPYGVHRWIGHEPVRLETGAVHHDLASCSQRGEVVDGAPHDGSSGIAVAGHEIPQVQGRLNAGHLDPKAGWAVRQEFVSGQAVIATHHASKRRILRRQQILPDDADVHARLSSPGELVEHIEAAPAPLQRSLTPAS